MPNVQKGINIGIIINDKVVAGQLNVNLARNAKSIDITNKIDDEWARTLTSTKSWRITCDGMYVKSNEAFEILQEAFLNNTAVKVKVQLDDKEYSGDALIVDFPLSSAYNNTYRYNVRLLGDGELKYNDIDGD